MKKDWWYDQCIEEPVRKAVKALRNEGINTQCSCGHDMTIQCEFLGDHELDTIYNVLTRLGYDEYRVYVYDDIYEGRRNSYIEILLPDINGEYFMVMKENKKFIKNKF